jgi:hypothetical protein
MTAIDVAARKRLLAKLFGGLCIAAALMVGVLDSGVAAVLPVVVFGTVGFVIVHVAMRVVWARVAARDSAKIDELRQQILVLDSLTQQREARIAEAEEKVANLKALRDALRIVAREAP